MEERITEHLVLVKNALVNIDSLYLKLPTSYKRAGITRERIFCYEFYHQMRLIQSIDDPLYIHGEIDKRGHILFLPEHRTNPDFVVHHPSKMPENAIVIEVKGYDERRKPSRAGICKDFNTLLNFTELYEYKLGIFIVFSCKLDEFIRNYSGDLQRFKSRATSNNVVILALPIANQVCEECFLSELPV